MSITWDESAPGDAGQLSQGAGAIRGLKVAIADGVEPSMYWPGSGGGSAASAGVMTLGTFRTGYGVASAVSISADVDSNPLGRLYYASDTSRVYSIQTSMDSLAVLSGYAIGHPQSLLSTARWVVSRGTVQLGNTATFGPTYNGIPRVLASMTTTVKTPSFPVNVKIDSITATQFTPSGYSVTDLGGWAAVTGPIVDWLSIGSVSF